jgi:diguanylate cyclase (GGDEF)-like protein
VENKGVTIAVVAPIEPLEFFEVFWEGVWSAAYELAPFGVRVLTVTTASFDPAEQSQALCELLSEDVDAIVLLPAHSSRLDALIAKHTAKGIPVLTVFHDAPASGRRSFVGPDFRLSGRLAGEFMSKVMPPHSHIVALTGPRDNHSLNQRYEGFREALRASCVPLGITELSEPEDIANVIAGRSQKFDGLYLGCSDSPNMGEILRQLRAPASCVTFELTDVVRPFLESGRVSAVIDSSRYYQGYIAVQKAFEWVNLGAPETAWISIPCSVMLAAHANAARGATLIPVFEHLVKERTLQLRKIQQELDVANARIMQLAETDPLTGLPNRVKFEELLQIEMQRSDMLSLLVVDLDEFKPLNDFLGRSAGDQALRAVAGLLRSECRPTDIVARIGGDRFGVIVPEATREAALALRERVGKSIQSARVPGHPDLGLSATIGIASSCPKMPGAEMPYPADLTDAAERDLLRAQNSSSVKIIEFPKAG